MTILDIDFHFSCFFNYKFESNFWLLIKLKCKLKNVNAKSHESVLTMNILWTTWVPLMLQSFFRIAEDENKPIASSQKEKTCTFVFSNFKIQSVSFLSYFPHLAFCISFFKTKFDNNTIELPLLNLILYNIWYFSFSKTFL